MVSISIWVDISLYSGNQWVGWAYTPIGMRSSEAIIQFGEGHAPNAITGGFSPVRQ
jgi:hypothetical protein